MLVVVVSYIVVIFNVPCLKNVLLNIVKDQFPIMVGGKVVLYCMYFETREHLGYQGIYLEDRSIKKLHYYDSRRDTVKLVGSED